MMLQEIKLFKCEQLLCGQSMTFLHMLCYLDEVQKESLLALVLIITLILTILSIVGKCVTWIRVFLPTDHPWRCNKKSFNGKTEFMPPPPLLKETDVLHNLRF